METITDLLLIDNFLVPDWCKILIEYEEMNAPNDMSQGFWDSRIVTRYNGLAKLVTDNLHQRIIGASTKFFKQQMYLEFSNLVYWGENMELDPHADNVFIDKPDEPHYCAHRDYSSILYLNDSFEGGETYFPNQDYTVEPKVGRLIVFPSGPSHVHGVKKVTKGKRYTFATWYTQNRDYELKF